MFLIFIEKEETVVILS